VIRRGRAPADSPAALPLFESLRGGSALLLATTLLAGCGAARLVVPVDCRVVEGAVPSTVATSAAVPSPAFPSPAVPLPGAPSPAGTAPFGRAPEGDTVEIRLTLDRASSSEGGRVMVRVDPLAEPGAVAFTADVPPTSVAVSATVTTSGVFHGCLGAAPVAFDLVVPAVPKGRVWVRVSSDRPVLLKVLPDPGPSDPPGGGTSVESVPLAELSLAPGRSGEAVWRGAGGSAAP
jgi:hypothetical protein